MDIKLLENNNNSEQTVVISAGVAESQELGAVVPCDNITFPSTTKYQVLASNPPNPTKKYAGIELGKKFNQKIDNNHCVFYTQVTKMFLPDFKTSSSSLTAEQMVDAYCFFKSEIAKLNLPAGFTISSVVVKGDMLSCTGCTSGKLGTTVFIGIKNIKPNCNPNTPPTPPIFK